MKEFKLYACGVDLEYEVGEASDLEGSMPFYSSVEELKENKGCWESCGIVELKTVMVGWVEPQNLFSKSKK